MAISTPSTITRRKLAHYNHLLQLMTIKTQMHKQTTLVVQPKVSGYGFWTVGKNKNIPCSCQPNWSHLCIFLPRVATDGCNGQEAFLVADTHTHRDDTPFTHTTKSSTLSCMMHEEWLVSHSCFDGTLPAHRCHNWVAIYIFNSFNERTRCMIVDRVWK